MKNRGRGRRIGRKIARNEARWGRPGRRGEKKKRKAWARVRRELWLSSDARVLRRGPARREKRRMRSRQDASAPGWNEEGWSGREQRTDIYLETNVTLLWTYRCQKANNGTIFAPSALAIFRFCLLLLLLLFPSLPSPSSSSSSPWPSTTSSSISRSFASRPPGEEALAGLSPPRFLLRARFRERRMRVRYVDAVVGAAVSRHRIYRGRTARRYVKEGAAANLSTRSIADKYLGRSTCIPSILCSTFAYISFFFFFSLSLFLSVALDAASTRFSFHADFSKLV